MPPRKKAAKKASVTLLNASSAARETKKLQKKIIFCKGTEVGAKVFRDNEALREQYRKKITQLLMGDYSGLDIDYKGMHQGIKAWTMKLNDKARVLFSFPENEDTCSLVIRELLIAHDYQHSKILRNLPSAGSTAGAVEIEFNDAHDITSSTLLNIEYLAPEEVASGIRWFNDKVITLSETQENACHLHAHMPFLVEGPPGSGKSLVLLTGLANYVVQHNPEDGDIVVVAESEKIVAYLKKLWEDNFPEARGEDGQLLPFVHFKTYKQVILEKMDPEQKPATEEAEATYFTGYEAFKAWYKTYRARKTVKTDEAYYLLPEGPKKLKAEALEELLCKAVYQELRMISGWKGYPEAIGQKDSYFDVTTDNAERNPREIKAWITQVYRDYPHKNSDLAFLEISEARRRKSVAAIFSDEVQDFSTEQYKFLSNLSGGQLGGYLDSLQSVKADKPIVNALKAVLNTQELVCDDSHVLPDTYRCPPVIAQIATPVIAMRNELAGGTGRKGAPTTLSVAETEQHKMGNAHLYITAPSSHEQETMIEEIRGHFSCYKPTEIVIITYENKADVKAIFGADVTVFTPEEAKGLEFDLVVLWHPMGRPSSTPAIYEMYKTANRKLVEAKEASGGSSSFQHQAMLENMDNRFSRLHQEWFTAITRSKQRVICCIDPSACSIREQGEIVARFATVFPEPQALPLSDTTLTSTNEEWHTIAYNLLLSKNTESASEIIQKNFYREEMDVCIRLRRYLIHYYIDNLPYHNKLYEGLPVESKLFIQSVLGKLGPKPEKLTLAKLKSAAVPSKPPLELMIEQFQHLFLDYVGEKRRVDVEEKLIELFGTLNGLNDLHDTPPDNITKKAVDKMLLGFFDELLANAINRQPVVSLFHRLAQHAMKEEYKMMQEDLEEEYQSHVLNTPSLFFLKELMRAPAFIEKLKTTLIKNKLLGHISADPKLPSLLYCLSASIEGRAVLHQVFSSQAVVATVTGRAFFQCINGNSAFSFLGSEDSGRLAKKLFEHGKILDGTPVVSAFQAAEQSSRLFTPIFLLYQLLHPIVTDESYWLTAQLKKPEIAKMFALGLTPELMNSFLPTEAEAKAIMDFPNVPPLSLLFSLSRILKHSHLLDEMAKKITPDTLCQTFEKDSTLKTFNPMLQLCIDVILNDIQTRASKGESPSSYQDIFSAMFEAIPDESHWKPRDQSLFFGIDRFFEVLNVQIITSPERAAAFAEAVVVSILSANRMSFQEKVAAFVNNFLNSQEGIKLFVKLIEANQRFVRKICFLLNCCTYNSKGQTFISEILSNQSTWPALITLFSQPEGWNTLKNLIEKNCGFDPLIKIILDTSVTVETKKLNSVFHCIISSDAVDLSYVLVRNILLTERIQALKIPLLKALFQFSRNREDGCLSPFFALSSREENQPLLLNIIETLTDEILRHNSTTFVLCTPLRGAYEGQSPLHHLVKTETGLQILGRLFQSYPGDKRGQLIFSQSLAEHLCKESFFLENKTPLAYICGHESPTAKSILHCLVQNTILRDLVSSSSAEQVTLGQYNETIESFFLEQIDAISEATACASEALETQERSTSRSSTASSLLGASRDIFHAPPRASSPLASDSVVTSTPSGFSL